MKPNNVKVLVTGGRGFLGAHLVQLLRTKGYRVSTFDTVDRQSILNLDEIENAVKSVDVVYHLAAQADFTKMRDPSGGYNGATLNAHGTNNVAFACAKHKKWLIYISTVCVYGNQLEHPTNEESMTNPGDLYSYTKLAGELMVKGYSANFGNPYTIFRIPTMYGEGMRAAMGMYIFMKAAVERKPIPVHGDGEQTRTLTYVGDVADALVLLLLCKNTLSYNETFVVSSGYAVSALQMARDVKELANSTSEITLIPQRPNQTMKEDFSCAKVASHLGWDAKTSWEEGLKKTFEWFIKRDTY